MRILHQKEQARLLLLLIFLSMFSGLPSVAQIDPTLLAENVRSPFGVTGGIGAIHPTAQVTYDANRFLTDVSADAKRAALLNAKWYRIPSSQYGSFAFDTITTGTPRYALQDALIQGLQSQQLQVLPVLGPWTSTSSCNQLFSYLPANLEEYANYVRQTVQRYDFDGRDDMLHMRYPVRYWQIDSDVDVRWLECDRKFATPQEYFAILKTSYAAIKTVDPKAKVLLGLGLFDNRPEGLQYLQELLALGAASFFDIANYRDFTYDIENLVGRILQLRGLTHKPVWVTEASVPSDSRANPNWSTSLHARTLFKYYVRAIVEGGAERLFWSSLDQEPAQPDSPHWKAFGSNGLYTCENVHTDQVLDMPVCGSRELGPGARTYRLAARKLMTFVDHHVLQHINAIPPFAPVKAYVFEFSEVSSNDLLYVLWSEAGTATVALSEAELDMIATHIIEQPGQTDSLITLENSRFIEVGLTPMFVMLGAKEREP